MRLAVFTVCPNHRVPQARALLDTVARFLPGASRVLVLADEPHPCVPYPAGCQVVPARALGVPDFPQFAFRYEPAAFAAALRPFAVRFLFDTGACTHCLFFEPDIELFGALPGVVAALAADAPFVLTPPAPADGGFGLGFLGVSSTPAARGVLGWWARWLRRDCVNDPAPGLDTGGLDVDRRFAELAPGFAPGTRVLHDPGLNVSVRTLAGRRFVPDAPGGPLVDDAPLGFIRYGEEPGRWEGAFLAGYAARLAAAGGGTIPAGGYAYGRFASGVPIPAVARAMFRDDHEAWAGDPFETYEAWCHLPAPGGVPGLGGAVPSLVAAKAAAGHSRLAGMSVRAGEGEGSAGLVRWWLDHRPGEGGRGGGIDRRFLQPLASAAGRRALRPGAVRPAPAPDRADVTVVAPFSAAADPAGLVGRGVADGLARAGRVERLDVLAGSTQPAAGRVLVVCLAPRQLRPFLHVLGPRLPSRAYRVFVPSGEAAELSPAFLEALTGFDEVWAPTGFLQSRLVLAVGVPVLRMPVLHMPVLPFLGRGEAGFTRPTGDGGTYVLAVGDALGGGGGLSAAVGAYRDAFRGVPGGVRPRLVVCDGAAHAWDGALRDAVAAVDGVVASEMGGLVAGAACVLALHRGEALGLSVLRAMAAGVPVVATDDGGCMDVLTPRTGFPVEARAAVEATVGAAVGAGGVEADACHAAWSLREVLERPDEARRRAARGRRAVAAAGGPGRVAGRLAGRLAALGLLPAEHMPGGHVPRGHMPGGHMPGGHMLDEHLLDGAA